MTPSSGIDSAAIRSILGDYLSPLPLGIEDRVHVYLELLEKWGRKMPLTSLHGPEELVRFHFGESIFALSLVEMSDGRLADVGTGAGFPGLALKLVRPSLRITLIERNKKKCAFLHEVARSLELQDVEIIPVGFETSGIARHSIEYATCRAVGGNSAVLAWAKTVLSPSGFALFWISASECAVLRSEDDWVWQNEVLIPGTRERFIISGSRDSDNCST